MRECRGLLQQGVSVSIVDVVTTRHFNLYADLLASVGRDDPTLGDPVPPTYAAACRWTRRGRRKILEAWSHVLSVGKPMPVLPLWLNPDLCVRFDLEPAYEQACRDLWIV